MTSFHTRTSAAVATVDIGCATLQSAESVQVLSVSSESRQKHVHNLSSQKGDIDAKKKRCFINEQTGKKDIHEELAV